ncbi:MAG TPA: hypothetical protein VLS93_08170 [Anaeromyxobacteraceae bacterium]|nr:hypothetical protein [Anaeromyxobacteraceae bacterium]
MRAALLLAVALLAAPPPAAAEEPRFESEIELGPGETRIVTPGPVRNVLCDRGDVVERVSTEQGNGFRGLAPGETACTLVTADGVRRTFHVKVVEKKR